MAVSRRLGKADSVLTGEVFRPQSRVPSRVLVMTLQPSDLVYQSQPRPAQVSSVSLRGVEGVEQVISAIP